MIKFGLFKNHLIPNANNYRAVIQDLEIIDDDDLLKEMIVPGGVTATQASAVLTAWYEAIEKALKSGKGVKTKLMTIKPSVKGVFEDEDDDFDATKHFVGLNIFLRNPLRNIAKLLRAQKIKVRKPAPMIRHFIDTATQQNDKVISVGMVGELAGEFLKCDPNDEDQGVFIIKSDGSDLRIASFIYNAGTKLIFFLPNTLNVGDEVKIEVRNKLDNRIKELRTSRFFHALTVVEGANQASNP